MILLIAFPSIATALPAEDVIDTDAGDYSYPKPPLPPELPLHIRSNCWEYVKHIFPNTPSTEVILSNLGPEGEIGVLTYYGWLKHYVVVLENDGALVSFCETNLDSTDPKKTCRTLPVDNFDGFYDL